MSKPYPHPADWTPDFAQAWMVSRATPERIATLAETLGVTAASLDAIGVGWLDGDALADLHPGCGGDGPRPTGAYVLPEYGPEGDVIGLHLRAEDGRKGSPRGGRRGVIVPESLEHAPAPCLVVEGASDVAACLSLGLAAVGRPSNNSGADIVHSLIPTREILIVGENDAKPDGAWPGRDGAIAVARRLAELRGEPVPWALPPDGAKDIREWLRHRIEAGLDLRDRVACRAAGMELLSALKAAAVVIEPGVKAESDGKVKGEKEPKRSQADELADLAFELYRPGRDEADTGFMVRKTGPNLAVSIGGPLKRALAKEFRQRTGRTPNAQALADAVTAVGGVADDCPKERTYLRVARNGDDLVIDQGTETGSVIVVKGDGSGWKIEPTSPILFRRSSLTGPMPDPVAGGDIHELQDLLALSDDDFPIVIAWLIVALIEDFEPPILLLGGEQGTGKTTRARRIVGLIDPSPVELRSPPRDEENWAVTTAASWGIAVDNVSHIPGWWSDALCRVCTGDGHARRRRYTDADVAAERYKRPVMLTSIDVGNLRGDLGDRVVLLDCPTIPDSGRVRASELRRQFDQARPRILGALLTMTSKVLAHLPEVELRDPPRMGDYGAVLAAADHLLGTAGLRRYLDQRGRIHTDCLESDAVAARLVEAMAARKTWVGTASELHALLTPERPPAGWPRDPRALGARLARAAPALRHAGVAIEKDRAPKTGARTMTITRLEKAADCLSPLSAPSSVGPTSIPGRQGLLSPPNGNGRGDKAGDKPRQASGALVGSEGDKPDKGDKQLRNISVGAEGEASVALEFEQPVPEPGAAETGGTTGDDPPPGWTRESWAAACAADAAGLPGFTREELDGVRRVRAAAARSKKGLPDTGGL